MYRDIARRLAALGLVLAVLALLAGCTKPPTQQTAETTQTTADATADGGAATATVPVTLGFQPASERPLYATLCVSQDGSRVMRLMLDESKGTGTGYDALYADANLDGTLSAEERFEAQQTESSGDFTYASFKPVELTRHYADLGEGQTQADRSAVTYLRAGSEDSERILAGLHLVVGLEGEAEPWTYGLSGQAPIALSPTEVVVWDCSGKPSLRVETEAGERGSLGVAVVASVGDAEVMCPQATVNVVVRTPEGRELARDQGSLIDFGFG